ncbi:MAG: type II secretion system GspH family protein, partial [Nitrospiraceae bacterium]|nr:type II secretion system GspH family protein [Nitrospiraceae bacterium]
MLNPGRNQKGFTIVELAIVLVVIGILLGVGASLIGPLTKRIKFNESREVVRAAREAVVGFAITNKQLPATLAAAGARDTDAWGRQLYYSTNMAGVQLCTSAPTFLANVTDNRRSPAVTLTNSVVVMLFSLGENGANNTGTGPFTIEQQFTNDYDDIVEYIDISFLREKVCNSLKITTESLPLGVEESVYPATTLEASDGTIPYAWSIVSGALPA